MKAQTLALKAQTFPDKGHSIDKTLRVGSRFQGFGIQSRLWETQACGLRNLEVEGGIRLNL